MFGVENGESFYTVRVQNKVPMSIVYYYHRIEGYCT